MSRAGYDDYSDGDGPPPEFWRQAVARAIAGKRGQEFLRDFIKTLDAMPVKKLAAHSFQNEAGEVCALGAVCVARGISMAGFVEEYCEEMDRDLVGTALNIAPAMAGEIVYENDEGNWRSSETDEGRWQRMRAWAEKNLVTPAVADAG